MPISSFVKALDKAHKENVREGEARKRSNNVSAPSLKQTGVAKEMGGATPRPTGTSVTGSMMQLEMPVQRAEGVSFPAHCSYSAWKESLAARAHASKMLVDMRHASCRGN